MPLGQVEVQGINPNKSIDLTNPVKMAAVFKAVIEAITTGQKIEMQCDDNGFLRISALDPVTKTLRMIDTAPENQITSDEGLIYNAAAIDYRVDMSKAVAPVSELWLNTYGGGFLMVKITSGGGGVDPAVPGAWVPLTCLIEIQTSMPTLTTPADYVTVQCASVSMPYSGLSETVFFKLPVGRFFLSLTPIGAVSAGVNKITVTAALMSRGLMC